MWVVERSSLLAVCDLAFGIFVGWQQERSWVEFVDFVSDELCVVDEWEDGDVHAHCGSGVLLGCGNGGGRDSEYLEACQLLWSDAGGGPDEMT
jgi:hypothetical protein